MFLTSTPLDRAIQECVTSRPRLCLDFRPDMRFVGLIKFVKVSRHRPPWECVTSEAVAGPHWHACLAESSQLRVSVRLPHHCIYIFGVSVGGSD